jgi:hypothetical protein
MREFTPQNISNNLAELNLSFNKLKEIPRCIEALYDYNKHIVINLSQNDFWYTMYSDLPSSLISPQTMPELVFANKLNLLSLTKLKYCANILKEKNYSKEAETLAKQIGIRLKVHQYEEAKNTFSNSQNVHLTSIQSEMKQNMSYISNYKPKNPITDKNKFMVMLQKELNIDSAIYYDLSLLVEKKSYYDVLYKVFYICKESQHKNDLYKILKNEIIDGIKTCLTGQITRLINTLSGYDPNIKVSISKNEELANSIIAIRKKYAIMYLHERHIIDVIEARCPSEAKKKLLNPVYFIATEVKE